MCGIVALISKKAYGFDNTDVELFRNMLVCNFVRGQDSTGVFGVDKFGNVDYLKEVGHPLYLIDSNEYKNFQTNIVTKMKILVGHNRSATKGTVSDKNAHPFVEGKTILVHNGTLWNHKDLKDVEVDSHAIVHAIEEKGYKQAIESLEGAFALIWYNAKTNELFITRNKERPLYIAETSYNYIIASEADMINWLLNRNYSAYIKNPDKIPKIFEPEKIYKFVYDKLGDCSYTTEEYTEKKPQAPVFTTSYQKTGANTTTIKEKEWKNPQQQPYKKSENIILNTNFQSIEDFHNSFKNGQTVAFDLKDFEIYSKSGKSGWAGYDGELKGTYFYDSNIEVLCHFRGTENNILELMEYDYISCSVRSTAWRNNPRVMRIICSNPVGGSIIVPENQSGIFVTDDLWSRLTENSACKCGRCHTHIKLGEISKTFLKLKSDGSIIIRCQNCIKEYKEKGEKAKLLTA